MFPARAGMSLVPDMGKRVVGGVPRASGDEPASCMFLSTVPRSVPRASGDEPSAKEKELADRRCSPRERG